jgi:hypothetical protein
MSAQLVAAGLENYPLFRHPSVASESEQAPAKLFDSARAWPSGTWQKDVKHYRQFR